MVALTTLMCPAWSGVFFLRNPQPGLQHEPQHMADPLRPTKREREIQVQAPVPADCPAPRRKSWLSRSPRHLRQHPGEGLESIQALEVDAPGQWVGAAERQVGSGLS